MALVAEDPFQRSAMYFQENFCLFGGKQARSSGKFVSRIEGPVQVGWNFPYKTFQPDNWLIFRLLMILQSITWKPTRLPCKHKMKIRPVKRASPICQLTLLTSSTTPQSHFSRIAAVYCVITNWTSREKGQVSAFSFSFTLNLKSQINLAIWRKEIAVKECDFPHANRSWKIQPLSILRPVQAGGLASK